MMLNNLDPGLRAKIDQDWADANARLDQMVAAGQLSLALNKGDVSEAGCDLAAVLTRTCPSTQNACIMLAVALLRMAQVRS